MRRLMPRMARRFWSGSAPVWPGDIDVDAEGTSFAIAWLGFSIELVFAREDAATRPTTRKENP